MANFGVDYAGGRPNPAALVAHGYTFACRYLSPGGPALPGKLLTVEEYTALTGAGVAVVANWETDATRMLGGFAAGVSDAAAATATLIQVGHPLDRPVYFSADFDATPGDQVAIDAYLGGVASVLGLARTGVYGGYWVVKRCLDNGTAVWAWQATAWSGGQVDSRAHMLQHVAAVIIDGVECDVNEALRPDYGQHPSIQSRPGRKDHTVMDQLPATPPPADQASDPKTWPQRNYDVGFDLAGGWEGEVAIEFGAQDWGGRKGDDVRGFLYLVSWHTPAGLVPADPAYTVAGGGRPIHAHTPTVALVAPHGATALTLNYAAPGGAYVAQGRSA